MKRAEVLEAAEVLGRIVSELEAGTLTAPAGMVDRLAGAVVALEAVAAGGNVETLLARLGYDRHGR